MRAPEANHVFTVYAVQIKDTLRKASSIPHQEAEGCVDVFPIDNRGGNRGGGNRGGNRSGNRSGNRGGNRGSNRGGNRDGNRGGNREYFEDRNAIWCQPVRFPR